jgi:uncharacterized membrane protein
MENIVTAIFKVESQAYQAFSKLKRDPYTDDYWISGMAVVKKQNGHIALHDSFGAGFEVADNTVMGGLMGGLVGILGGPIGMLMGGSIGLITGSAVGTGEETRKVTLAERVTTSMKDGDVALIAMVQEMDEARLDTRFKEFDAIIMRRDAATVEDEVKEAQRVQKELEKQAKKELRAQKSAERKAKIEKQKEKIKQSFDDFKQKHPRLVGAKSSSK